MYQLCRCVIRTPYIIYILASCLSLFHFIAPLLHSYTPLTNWSLYETRFPFYRKIHKFGGKHSSRFCLSPLEFQFKCPFIYSQNNNERCYPQLVGDYGVGVPSFFFPSIIIFVNSRCHVSTSCDDKRPFDSLSSWDRDKIHRHNSDRILFRINLDFHFFPPPQ